MRGLQVLHLLADVLSRGLEVVDRVDLRLRALVLGLRFELVQLRLRVVHLGRHLVLEGFDGCACRSGTARGARGCHIPGPFLLSDPYRACSVASTFAFWSS